VIEVLGEVVVDLVEQSPGLYRAHPGGSPLNVAVGLGRLGRPTALRARIGADAFGPVFRRHLAASGVDGRGLVAASQPSTLAVASLDADGVASYDFWLQGSADWQWTPAELAAPLGGDVLALHTGSLALEVEPGASLIVDLLRRERERGQVTISYDPNVRLARRGDPAAGRARVEDVVRLAGVVKASADDLDWLYPGAGPQEVARRWLELGPGLVVITLGAAGAYGATAGGVTQQRPARPVTVVDTVGAGDAFTAGLLDGLAAAGALGAGGAPGTGGHTALAGLGAAQLARLLDRAGLVAALTCARAGADPPTLADLDAWRPTS
jgi:fructokinase